MAKETSSVRIEPDLWKAAKKRAIDLDMRISQYIEDLIKKDLKNKD